MQIRLHLNRDLKEERARTLNLPGGEMCAWQGEKLLQQPWCKSPGEGACLTCSSFLKKEANLGRLMDRRESEEKWSQRMLKKQGGLADANFSRHKDSPHPHYFPLALYEIVAKVTCIFKWMPSFDWILVSLCKSHFGICELSIFALRTSHTSRVRDRNTHTHAHTQSTSWLHRLLLTYPFHP